MSDRQGSRLRPRVPVRMNTDTRRHAEKVAYRRKNKYRDDPLDTVEPELDDEANEPDPDAEPADEDEDEDAGTSGAK